MKVRTEKSQLIGRRIDRARRARNVSVERLAFDLDISPSTMRRYIDGDTEPSFRVVCQIAGLLAYPVDWFAAEEGEAA
jgi:transcriptional regulator with XRE-family HTH domain